MKLKGSIAAVLAAIICMSFFCSAAAKNSLKMYSADGREITVDRAQLEAYKNVGWNENKNEVVKTLYSVDGRELTVFLDEVETYLNLGWYANKSDVTKTLYSADGRKLTVFLNEVEAYKKVGWYDNISDVTKTMYSLDGREITVFFNDVEAYREVGWYDSISDVTTTMYSLDGREITVFLNDVEAYKKVGWYQSKPTYTYAGIRKIDTSKPMLAITFDDGPKASTTPIILDVLAQYDAKATFFVQGANAQRNPSVIKRINNMGCQVASHTYNHSSLTSLSDANITYQVSTTDSIIKNIIGIAPSVLRPPYGAHNQHVRTVAGKPFILWSVDTLDWKYRDALYVSDYVLSHAYDGAVILLHDIHATTAQAAKSFIPGLISKGYQLVTIDELAYYKGYTLHSGAAYSSFK